MSLTCSPKHFLNPPTVWGLRWCNLHFWLPNVLRATTACTFSTLQLRKVVWRRCALYILTWKCASRHKGVQVFISHLASWLRTGRFSKPTFRPSGATNHGRNKVFRGFPTFSRTCIFFLLRLSLFWFSFFFSSLLFSSLLFSSLLFSSLLFSSLLFSSLLFSSLLFSSLLSSLLFSSLFSSLTLPISAFHLSILSEVWLLNFLR